jgi:Domain of unknown function (DUF4145)
MDGFQFTAAIISSLVSLAWPVALVICVLLFRERLRTLLPFMRLKHKETEVSFRLEQAEKEAAQIPQTLPSPDLEPTPEEKSRFEKVAEHSPRAAILEKRAELEQALRAFAEPYSERIGPTRLLPLMGVIRLLRKKGIIDETTSAILDDLRTIGNQAAHNPDGTEFTTLSAIRFGKLADSVIIRML